MTTIINTETELVTLVTQEVQAATDPTALAPVVEQLAGVQSQLVGLMTQEAAAGLASDPAFQTDLSNLVTDQGELTTLLNMVGSASGSAST